MSSPPLITRDDVTHLARLARLALTEDEVDSFTGQLGAIPDHVSRIQVVDAAQIPATGDRLAAGVARPDAVAPSLTQAEALAAAPSVTDGRFAVPQILGEPQ